MPQLVISGMHRSGTSLLANLLGKAGLPLGNRLRGPSEFNQKGHFEDDDFVEFHEDLLTANGTSIYLGSMPDPLRIDDSFQERAKALVSARADRSVWGWKDPRTALFLEFWDRILPDAHYLFIYRRLEEVVDSLRRRADLGLVPRWHGAWPLQQIGLCRFSPTRAIRMWLHYNQSILRFMEKHPGRTYLVHLGDLMDRFPALIAHLHDDWGIPLEPIDPAATFERRLLQTKVRSLMLFKLLRWRPIARTVRDLERHSDRINRGP